jgi:cytochrome P450
LSATPVYEADFYSDAFIRDPWPHYARMRELGPVVWLPEHGNFALTRHATVLAALRDPDLFVSGRGVAACEFANEITRGNSAASDGDRHRAIREASSGPLTPEALEAIRGRMEEAAAELVDKLIAAGEFDAMADLASHLPLTVVRELVGLPDFGRDNMLRWADATFNLLGVQNSRGRAALEVFSEQRRFVTAGATPDALRPDSWSRRLFDLVERGELAPDLAPVCMRDYLNPSLDTTISATGELIFRLARHPDQWALLRERPDHALRAANEAVRLASPVRSFARHASRSAEIEGVEIPDGARVMMLFASANRDERAFDRPDAFDITRDPRRHLGFGAGIHMCLGRHLAQLEMTAILKAMLARVEEIEVAEPTVALNNTIYRYEKLPARFRPR